MLILDRLFPARKTGNKVNKYWKWNYSKLNKILQLTSFLSYHPLDKTHNFYIAFVPTKFLLDK